MMKARTKPNSAIASTKAMPRNIVVRTMPACLGLTGHRLDGLADEEADADARADGAEAEDEAVPDVAITPVLLREDGGAMWVLRRVESDRGRLSDADARSISGRGAASRRCTRP
jgi:hypothetical protein